MSVHHCGGLGVDGRSACTHEVIEVVGDVPLCLLHRSRVAKDLNAMPRPVMTLPVSEAAKRPTTEWRGGRESIVYYFGDPDTSLVKIGTTTGLFRRLESLRRHRPRLLLLATEPGNYSVESERHRQFKALHNPLPNGEREWFRKAPILMDHIGHMRIKYGILATDKLPYLAWVAPLKAPAASEPASNNGEAA